MRAGVGVHLRPRPGERAVDVAAEPRKSHAGQGPGVFRRARRGAHGHLDQCVQVQALQVATHRADVAGLDEPRADAGPGLRPDRLGELTDVGGGERTGLDPAFEHRAEQFEADDGAADSPPPGGPVILCQGHRNRGSGGGLTRSRETVSCRVDQAEQPRQPAANLPLSWHEDLPIGIQAIGRIHDEATLYRLSAQLEAARPWADRRPPIA